MYKYSIYYGSEWLRDSNPETEYETEEDAREDAELDIESYKRDWETERRINGLGEEPEDEKDQFHIEIEEV